MQLATVFSRCAASLAAPAVRVEVHTSGGLHRLNLVGLAETSVKESGARVRAAILNNGFKFPSGRVTVNLAPAELRKEGGHFDLPIAIGILVASGQLEAPDLARYELAGELSLAGDLHPLRGALPLAVAGRGSGRALILSRDSAVEAAIGAGAAVFAAASLQEVCAHLCGQQALVQCHAPDLSQVPDTGPDLAAVQGQLQARRALEIAAAGGHSLLLVGPPGTGKTMLAERLSGLLPPLSQAQAIESASISSLRGEQGYLRRWRRPPFRAPHHTASAAALAGGGRLALPGEISLAHNGVLFLDELPEFDRRVLEALREPLQSGRIRVARVAASVDYPASVQLIAAMNPCPCGYLGDPEFDCGCPAQRVATYRGRVSGPLLDRIDMHIEVARQKIDVLAPAQRGESSAVVRARVERARRRQQDRSDTLNAVLPADAVEKLTTRGKVAGLLSQAADQRKLSARAQHKVLRLARTIADLADSNCIEVSHLAEALGMRCLDRIPASGAGVGQQRQFVR